MIDRRDTLPKTPFIELSIELGLMIGRDVMFNGDFEEYIARLPADVDRSSLNLSLAGCRDATERLSDLYYLIRAFAAHETELRAWFDQRRLQLDRGPSVAA